MASLQKPTLMALAGADLDNNLSLKSSLNYKQQLRIVNNW